MPGETTRVVLATGAGVWDFASRQLATANGWNVDTLKEVTSRDIESLPYRGVISDVDTSRYGPQAVR
jgi:hypothetical protein